MEGMVFWIGVFVISLAVLIKSSQYFTGAAEKIGKSLGMPAFLVGVSIVAIGTSLPELVSSIIAVLEGSSEIVIGNVLGSNIANIFLILGVAGIMAKKRLKLSRDLIRVDLPILIGTAFLLAIMIWDGNFTIFEAILSLFFMVIYSIYLIQSRERTEKKVSTQLKGEVKENNIMKDWLILLITSAFIYLGARFTVESVVELSSIFNIGIEVIAVSAVALGTSLPELAVTLTAARKGKPEIAVGNILGSNIFNTLVVMGIPALFGTLVIPMNMILFTLPVMVIATFLFFFITQDKEITKWEGWMLIIFYILFIVKTLGMY